MRRLRLHPLTAIVALAFMTGLTGSAAETPSTAPLQVGPPAKFDSQDDLVIYFANRSSDVHHCTVVGRTGAYCFVWEDPFSGVAATMVYGYTLVGSQLNLCFHTRLDKLEPSSVTAIELHGNTVRMLCKGHPPVEVAISSHNQSTDPTP
jgi:hypothetical protein